MRGTYRIVSGQLTIGHNVETILKPARSHIPWPPNLVHGPFCGPKSTQIADIENPQNVAVVTVVRGQRHWNCWTVQLETSRVHWVELPSWQCNCQADLHLRYDYMRSLAHHSSSSAAIFFLPKSKPSNRKWKWIKCYIHHNKFYQYHDIHRTTYHPCFEKSGWSWFLQIVSRVESSCSEDTTSVRSRLRLPGTDQLS